MNGSDNITHVKCGFIIAVDVQLLCIIFLCGARSCAVSNFTAVETRVIFIKLLSGGLVFFANLVLVGVVVPVITIITTTSSSVAASSAIATTATAVASTSGLLTP